MMTLGSLFDGIGGFPLAAVHCGIVPVWASEIESFPMRVTQLRFPEMIHVGDITKLDGAKLLPVDVICGGSPCQDLSVAGLRKGLAGERSGLFMDQVRIVKEMRAENERRGISDDLVRPRYLVWENVPGAFSSANGEDFRAVIEEIVRIKECTCHVPRPDTGSWEIGSAWLGESWMLNTGESPSVAVGSSLSQILEDSPHPKYYLSRNACLGILRRAKARGKELPPQLETALQIQAGVEQKRKDR